MFKHNILFIGLDTYKVATEVAYIEDQRGAEAIHLDRILSNKQSIKKLVRQSIQTRHCISSTKLDHVVIGFRIFQGSCRV